MTTTPPARRSPLRRLSDAAARFVSDPASPRPLAAFRIGIAAVLLAQAAAIAGSLLDLYGSRGIVQWSVAERMAPPGVPRLSWLAAALAPLGVTEIGTVRLAFLLYVGALTGLLVGWRARASAAVAWATHVMLGASGTASTYGVDQWANIALFYCLWAPVGDTWSADRRAGRVSGEPSAAARLGLRVLQLHLCIAYLASGIEKASGLQWLDGEAVFRSVMRPDLAKLDLGWLASAPWVAVAACWATLVVEIGYAAMVWPRRTRAAWAVVTIGLHAGIAVAMGLWSFSAVMIVLTTSAFLVPAEPARGGEAVAAGPTTA